MCWSLYATTELETGPTASTEQWRRWARRVRRHQRRLMAELVRYLNAPGEAPRMTAAPAWLPWTIEDLASRRKHQPNYTSRYYGVVHTPPYMLKQGWLASKPRTAKTGRRKLGWFATEKEAAYAVLHALNPAAPTPASGETVSPLGESS
jgi:hypothetical protein